jgi:hypothetical protein
MIDFFILLNTLLIGQPIRRLLIPCINLRNISQQLIQQPQTLNGDIHDNTILILNEELLGHSLLELDRQIRLLQNGLPLAHLQIPVLHVEDNLRFDGAVPGELDDFALALWQLDEDDWGGRGAEQELEGEVGDYEGVGAGGGRGGGGVGWGEDLLAGFGGNGLQLVGFALGRGLCWGRGETAHYLGDVGVAEDNCCVLQ